jgi:natural product biosynthesis luciferase-like monooxygenase protein
VWLVTARNEDTFVEAGKIGANVLTSLILLSVEELAQRVALYRATLAKHGYDPEQGQVTLMLHTFLGDDIDKVRETVREPFYDYLRSHLEMIKTVAAHQNINMDEESLPIGDREALLSFAFERYFNTTSLCGTPSSCRSMIERLSAIGVNEIACLIDFGVDVDSTMTSLQHLSALKEQVAQG